MSLRASSRFPGAACSWPPGDPPAPGRSPRCGPPASPAPPRRAARRSAPGGPRRSCRPNPPRRAPARRRPCGPPGRAAGRAPAAAASSSSSAEGGIRAAAAGGMPMSTTVTSPARSAPGCSARPIFEKAKVTVASARTAGPRARPVSVEMPEGRSTASTRAPCERAAPRWPRWPPRRLRPPDASSPVPKMASTTTSPRTDRELLELLQPGHRTPALLGRLPRGQRFGASAPGSAERDGEHSAPGRLEGPRRDEPVATVVARPADHHHPSVGPRQRGGRVRDGPAGTIHERRRRDAHLLDGDPLDGPHLLRADQPHSRSPSRTTTAAATPASCVIERWTRDTPRSRATRSATPERRRRGAPSSRSTSTSVQWIPAGAPRALDAASLAAKRAAYGTARSARASQNRRSPSLKQRRRNRSAVPGRDPSPTRRRMRCDLHHVDPEPQDHGASRESRSFISRTARSMPTSTARDTMAWPMLSSSISWMPTTGRTFW